MTKIINILRVITNNIKALAANLMLPQQTQKIIDKASIIGIGKEDKKELR